jgi:hypothetical protein
MADASINPIAGGLLSAIPAIGGLLSSVYQGSAGDQAAAAQERALALEKQQYETNKQNLSPWTNAGTSALSNYQSLASGINQPGFNYKQPDFNFSTMSDPGAQYAIQQATQAINESASARGAAGGGTSKAIAAQINDIAQNNYANAFDRYLKKSQLGYGQAEGQYNRDLDYNKLRIGYQKDISDTGLSAAGALASSGNSITGQMANTASGIGASQAAGTLGTGNAIASGLNSAASLGMKLYGLSNTLDADKKGDTDNV